MTAFVVVVHVQQCATGAGAGESRPLVVFFLSIAVFPPLSKGAHLTRLSAFVVICLHIVMLSQVFDVQAAAAIGSVLHLLFFPFHTYCMYHCANIQANTPVRHPRNGNAYSKTNQ